MKAELEGVPDILREHDADLKKALTVPVPRTWGDERRYQTAHQPAAIARVLIDAIHTTIGNMRIAYVFLAAMKRRDRRVLATASLAGPKLEFFAELDGIITVNWEAWLGASPKQKVALMDHELCHFAAGDESGYVMVSHDVEEFGSIVRRWGMWKSDLEQFGHALAAQGDLFAAVTRA